MEEEKTAELPAPGGWTTFDAEALEIQAGPFFNALISESGKGGKNWEPSVVSENLAALLEKSKKFGQGNERMGAEFNLFYDESVEALLNEYAKKLSSTAQFKGGKLSLEATESEREKKALEFLTREKSKLNTLLYESLIHLLNKRNTGKKTREMARAVLSSRYPEESGRLLEKYRQDRRIEKSDIREFKDALAKRMQQEAIGSEEQRAMLREAHAKGVRDERKRLLTEWLRITAEKRKALAEKIGEEPGTEEGMRLLGEKMSAIAGRIKRLEEESRRDEGKRITEMRPRVNTYLGLLHLMDGIKGLGKKEVARARRESGLRELKNRHLFNEWLSETRRTASKPDNKALFAGWLKKAREEAETLEPSPSQKIKGIEKSGGGHWLKEAAKVFGRLAGHEGPVHEDVRNAAHGLLARVATEAYSNENEKARSVFEKFIESGFAEKHGSLNEVRNLLRKKGERRARAKLDLLHLSKNFGKRK
jgi:hypothetical protein